MNNHGPVLIPQFIITFSSAQIRMPTDIIIKWESNGVIHHLLFLLCWSTSFGLLSTKIITSCSHTVGQCVSFQHEMVCALFASTKKYWDRIEQITQMHKCTKFKKKTNLEKEIQFFSRFVYLGKNEFWEHSNSSVSR